MKKFIAKYLLYIYLNFVKDTEIELYKKWAIPFITILWFVRSTFVWVASILLFPIFMIGMQIEQVLKKNKKYIILIKNL